MDPVIINIPNKPLWSEKAVELREKFPSIKSLKWDKVFELDPVIAGRIVNDIIKIGGPSNSKPGKRASLTENEAHSRYTQLLGNDFSEETFNPTFIRLCQGKTIRFVAAQTDLNISLVHNLLKGREPKIDEMEKIARGFNKHPSFFLEYRIYAILDVLFNQLMTYPESSVVQYKKIYE